MAQADWVNQNKLMTSGGGVSSTPTSGLNTNYGQPMPGSLPGGPTDFNQTARSPSMNQGMQATGQTVGQSLALSNPQHEMADASAVGGMTPEKARSQMFQNFGYRNNMNTFIGKGGKFAQGIPAKPPVAPVAPAAPPLGNAVDPNAFHMSNLASLGAQGIDTSSYAGGYLSSLQNWLNKG